MSASEVTIAALAERLQKVEDELAIIRLIASYGPLVDCGSVEDAPGLFTDFAAYDVDGGAMLGAQAIASMLAGDLHQSCLRSGIAHAMGLPWVQLDVDAAIATNTTQVFLRDGETFRPWRVAQNVWRLERSGGRWRVTGRTNRLIGDNGEAIRILDEAVHGPVREG